MVVLELGDRLTLTAIPGYLASNALPRSSRGSVRVSSVHQACPLYPQLLTYRYGAANRRFGRVDDGRGNLGHSATPRFPSPAAFDQLAATVDAIPQDVFEVFSELGPDVDDGLLDVERWTEMLRDVGFSVIDVSKNTLDVSISTCTKVRTKSFANSSDGWHHLLDWLIAQKIRRVQTWRCSEPAVHLAPSGGARQSDRCGQWRRGRAGVGLPSLAEPGS